MPNTEPTRAQSKHRRRVASLSFLAYQTREFRLLLALCSVGHGAHFILRHYISEYSVFPVFRRE
jgi:hypothetical protein